MAVYITKIYILSFLSIHLKIRIAKNPTTADTATPTSAGTISRLCNAPDATASLPSKSAAARIDGIPRIKL